MAQKNRVIRTLIRNTSGGPEWTLGLAKVTETDYNNSVEYTIFIQNPKKILANVRVLAKDKKTKETLEKLKSTSIITPVAVDANFSEADSNVSTSLAFEDITDLREVFNEDRTEPLYPDTYDNKVTHSLLSYIRSLNPAATDTSVFTNFVIFNEAIFERKTRIPATTRGSKRTGGAGADSKEQAAINASLKNSLNVEDQGLLLMHLDKFDTIRNQKANLLGINQAYRNLIRVDVESADDNRYFANKLFNPPDLNKFMSATPLLLSALTPKIRLYKVIQNKNITEEKKRFQTLSFLVPFNEYLKFDQVNSDKDIEKSAKDFLKEYGKAYGAGIRSITINDSSGPETPTNVTANLKLIFSNYDQVYETQTIVCEEDPSQTIEFRYADLFTRNAAAANENDGTPMETKDDDSFRLKLVIGWSFDKKVLRRIGYGSSDLTTEQIKSIEVALAKSESVYMLGHQNFNITLEESGKVSADITYVSSIQKIFGSKNASVLYKTNKDGYAMTYDDITKNIHELEILKDSLDKIESDGREKASKGSNGKASLDQSIEKEIKKEREKILDDISQSKWLIHKGFLADLYKNSKIYKVKIKKEDIQKLKEKISSQQAKKQSPTLVLELQEIIKQTDIKIESIEDSKKQELSKKSEREILSRHAKEEELQKLGSELATKLAKSEIFDPKADREVVFLFLGDILDYAFGCLKRQDSVEFRHCIPVVGNFSHFKYKNPEKPDAPKIDGQVINLKLETTDRIPMNYCDLPISLERFKKFLFDEFVRPQVQAMRLEDFITRLFNKIIFQSMDANIFGEQLKKSFGVMQTGQATMRTVTVAGTEREYLTDNTYEDILDRKNMIKRINISDLKRNRINSDSMVGNSKLFNYFYMFSKAYDSLNGKVLNLQDRDQSGVVNIEVGADRGIVKKVNFSKINGLRVAESAFMSQGAKTNGDPMFISNIANADIEMIGNTYFRPGTMVYIDPSYLLKSPSAKKEEIEKYGAGGFYNIVKIFHEITPGKFITKTNATFSHSNNTKKTAPAQSEPTPAIIRTGTIASSIAAIEEKRQELEKERKNIENNPSGN
jgi:hypothetical protein